MIYYEDTADAAGNRYLVPGNSLVLSFDKVEEGRWVHHIRSVRVGNESTIFEEKVTGGGDWVYVGCYSQEKGILSYAGVHSEESVQWEIRGVTLSFLNTPLKGKPRSKGIGNLVLGFAAA